MCQKREQPVKKKKKYYRDLRLLRKRETAADDSWLLYMYSSIMTAENTAAAVALYKRSET